MKVESHSYRSGLALLLISLAFLGCATPKTPAEPREIISKTAVPGGRSTPLSDQQLRDGYVAVAVEAIEWGKSSLVQLRHRSWGTQAAGAVYRDTTALAVTLTSRTERLTGPQAESDSSDIPIAVLKDTSDGKDRQQKLSSGTVLRSLRSISESEKLVVDVKIQTTNKTESHLASLTLDAVNTWLQVSGGLPGIAASSVKNLPEKGTRADAVIQDIGSWKYVIQRPIEFSNQDLKEGTKYKVSIYDADPDDSLPILTFVIAPTFRASLFPSASANGEDFTALHPIRAFSDYPVKEASVDRILSGASPKETYAAITGRNVLWAEFEPVCKSLPAFFIHQGLSALDANIAAWAAVSHAQPILPDGKIKCDCFESSTRQDLSAHKLLCQGEVGSDSAARIASISMLPGCDAHCRPLDEGDSWAQTFSEINAQPLGAGWAVWPDKLSAEEKSFVLHDHKYKTFKPSEKRATISYEFDKPVLVTGVSVTQHANGIIKGRGEISDDGRTYSPIGEAKTSVEFASPRPQSLCFSPEQLEDTFWFDASSPGHATRFFRFVFTEACAQGGYAVYRARPLNSRGHPVLPIGYPPPKTK